MSIHERCQSYSYVSEWSFHFYILLSSRMVDQITLGRMSLKDPTQQTPIDNFMEPKTSGDGATKSLFEKGSDGILCSCLKKLSGSTFVLIFTSLLKLFLKYWAPHV